MGSHTRIEWADKTYNPWIGCTKVSPACANCYAERFGKRRGIEWGPGKPRRRTKTAKDVRKWNRSAAGEQWAESPEIAPPSRPKVFVASLADWLDNEVPVAWLADLLALIVECPHLDFLLLTKRPELWRERLLDVLDLGPTRGGHTAQLWLNGTPPANVWLGATVEDQRRADKRVPELLLIPAPVHFVSMEPLLEPVNLHEAVPTIASHVPVVDWVIAGGESGPNSRPSHPDWFRSLRDECQASGMAFFFKQWGEWAPTRALPIADREWDPLVDTVAMDGDRVADMHRVGKKRAGRQLDGREWSEVPA